MLSDKRLREIMKQWSAGQQTGHHIPDLLAEITRLKSELNGAYERAAKGLDERRATIERVIDVHGEDESIQTVQSYAVHHLLEAATAIRNLKEPT
jgi:hypothetical protein